MWWNGGRTKKRREIKIAKRYESIIAVEALINSNAKKINSRKPIS
jgi:hypothetical protein